MMFTLKLSAAVVILCVACNADTSFHDPVLNALNVRRLQVENALTLQMEQRKQQQEAVLLQLKAAEEQRNMAINLQTEAWKRAMERQKLQQDLLQKTLMPSTDDNSLPTNLNLITTNPQVLGLTPLNPALTTLTNNLLTTPMTLATTNTINPLALQSQLALAPTPPALISFSSPAQFSTSRAQTTSSSPFTSFSMPASFPLQRRGLFF